MKVYSHCILFKSFAFFFIGKYLWFSHQANLVFRSFWSQEAVSEMFTLVRIELPTFELYLLVLGYLLNSYQSYLLFSFFYCFSKKSIWQTTYRAIDSRDFPVFGAATVYSFQLISKP